VVENLARVDRALAAQSRDEDRTLATF
jgi:hypothetical protein